MLAAVFVVALVAYVFPWLAVGFFWETNCTGFLCADEIPPGVCLSFLIFEIDVFIVVTVFVVVVAVVVAVDVVDAVAVTGLLDL